MDLPILDYFMEVELMWRVVLCIWLLSPSVMFSKFIHVLAWDRASFFFMTK
jgi:hypothetical protein